MDRFDHYRWHHKDSKELASWKETLESMCACYGTFCGRWHSNEFWKRTAENLPNMTEEQCKEKVIQIEQEADADLAYWQAVQ